MSLFGGARRDDAAETEQPTLKKFRLDFPAAFAEQRVFKSENDEYNNNNNNENGDSENADFLSGRLDWADDIRKAEPSFDGFDAPPADEPCVQEATDAATTSTAAPPPALCFNGAATAAESTAASKMNGASPLDFLHLFNAARLVTTAGAPASPASSHGDQHAAVAAGANGTIDLQMAMLLHQVSQANSLLAAAAAHNQNNNNSNGLVLNNNFIEAAGICNNNLNNNNNHKRKRAKTNDFSSLNPAQFNGTKKLLEPRDAKTIAATLFSRGFGAPSAAAAAAFRSRQASPKGVSPAPGAPPPIPIPGALAVAASPAAILFSQDDWSWHRNPAASIRSGGTNKQTPVWKYFVYNKAENLSRCIVGTCTYTLKGPHTSTLACHLKKHPAQYAEFQRLKSIYTRERSAEQMSSASSSGRVSGSGGSVRPSQSAAAIGEARAAASESPSLAPSTSPCSSTFVDSRTASPRLASAAAKPSEPDEDAPTLHKTDADAFGNTSTADAVNSGGSGLDGSARLNFAYAAAAAAAALNGGAQGADGRFSTNIFGQVGAANVMAAMATAAAAAALKSRQNDDATAADAGSALPQSAAMTATARSNNSKSTPSMSDILEVLNRRAAAAAAAATAGNIKSAEDTAVENDCPTFTRLLNGASRASDTVNSMDEKARLMAATDASFPQKSTPADSCHVDEVRQRRLERKLAFALVELGLPASAVTSSPALRALLQDAQPAFNLPAAGAEATLHLHLDAAYRRATDGIKRRLAECAPAPVAVTIFIGDRVENQLESARVAFATESTSRADPTASTAALLGVRLCQLSALQSDLDAILAEFEIDERRVRVVHLGGDGDSVAQSDVLRASLRRCTIQTNTLVNIVPRMWRALTEREEVTRCDGVFRYAVARFALSADAAALDALCADCGIDAASSGPFCAALRCGSDVLAPILSNISAELRDTVDWVLRLATFFNAFHSCQRATFDSLLTLLCRVKRFIANAGEAKTNAEMRSVLGAEFDVAVASLNAAVSGSAFVACARLLCPMLANLPSEDGKQFLIAELASRLSAKFGDAPVAGDVLENDPDGELASSALCSNLIEAANKRIQEIESRSRSWEKCATTAVDEYLSGLGTNASAVEQPSVFWQRRVAEKSVALDAAGGADSPATAASAAAQVELSLLAAEILACPIDGAPLARESLSRLRSTMSEPSPQSERDIFLRTNGVLLDEID